MWTLPTKNRETTLAEYSRGIAPDEQLGAPACSEKCKPIILILLKLSDPNDLQPQL